MLVKLHYQILKRLEAIDQAPAFPLAPQSSCKLPFIEISKDSIKDLYNWSHDKSSKHIIKDQDRQSLAIYFNKSDEITLESVLNDKQLNRKSMHLISHDYGHAVMTAGNYYSIAMAM